MIQFNCPCGQTLAAADEHAGLTTVCPKCQSQVPIPLSSAIQTSAPPPVPHPPSEHMTPPLQVPPGPRPYTPPPNTLDPRHRPAPPTSKSMSAAAVISLILGLVSCIPGIGVLLAVAAIIVGIFGIVGATRGKSGMGLAIAGIILGVILIPVQILGTYYAIQKVRSAAARMVSANNMKLIVLGMHGYHDDHRRLPAHAIYSQGPDGRPLLNWRVALLPYIGENALYNQFKLDEPWDSPHNIQLLKKMPDCYKCFHDAEADEKGWTHYQMIVGEAGVMPRPVFVRGKHKTARLGITLSDMSLASVDRGDGTSNTIAIVEAAIPVPWTKPEDILYLPQQGLPKFGVFPSGYNVGLFDGSVFFKTHGQVLDETVHRAITYNDGKILGPDW